MVKPDNYILIYGWMVNDLKLKGNELLLYAMIYGFSQDGETEFSGSLRYMQEWLGAGSKHTVLSVIEKLISKGLIKKRTAIEKGVKRSFYMAAPRGGAKTAPVDGAETALGWCKNCTADGAETAPNNIEDILVIKDDDEERARDPRLDQELSRIIQAYQANIGTFPPAAVDELQRWRQIFSTEMLLLSIEEAAKNNAHSWRYISKVLTNWQSQHVFTPGDYKARQQRGTPAQQPRRSAEGDYNELFRKYFGESQ